MATLSRSTFSFNTSLPRALFAIIPRRNPLAVWQTTGLRPGFEIAGDGGVFALLLLTSWITAKIDRRKVADYGLPWRGAFGVRFLQGLAMGFVSITALLVAMCAAGVLHFGPMVLHGVEIWKCALLAGKASLPLKLPCGDGSAHSLVNIYRCFIRGLRISATLTISLYFPKGKSIIRPGLRYFPAGHVVFVEAGRTVTPSA